jgi:adenylate cyclase
MLRRHGAKCAAAVLYDPPMNDALLAGLPAWLTQAGLAGMAETDIVAGFCERCIAAGLSLGRVHLFIDTLHPVHEGRLFRWDHDGAESPLLEYGGSNPDALAAIGADQADLESVDRWRRSPFYRMLQTGESTLRFRLESPPPTRSFRRWSNCATPG